jgi:ABC-type dipeptide/oligopeptide/nickel transport system permease component
LPTSEPGSEASPTGRPRRLPSGRFLRFTLRRLAALLLLGVGVTLVSFVLTQLVPGDPAAANLGQRAIEDPAAVQAFRARYGLDRPLPVQYARYLERLAHGDLGDSQQSHRPVRDDLAEFVPATLELAGLAILLSLAFGIGLGLLAAMRRDRLVDQVLRVVSLAGVSMPTFWLALVAFWLFFFKLGLVPGSGRLDAGSLPPPHLTGLYTVDALAAGDLPLCWQALRHLLLPAAVLAAYTVSLLTRFTRTAVLEILGNDYIRAARAKGLPTRVVLTRHILRAALVPIITVAGLAFGNLLSGTVLVESIFSWPGIGQYAFRSATNLDLPAIMGVSLFVAVIYISINFLVDLLYGTIDPRIRLG